MTPQEALQKYFGYDNFRPMQAEVISEAMEGKDALVLMPTGGGKSVCYQIPALLREGVGVIVSPLISLMKDQVEALKANGIAAAYLNSSQPMAEQQAVITEVQEGTLAMLYVSPERLLTRDFYNLLKSIPVSVFAIDEAHCISAWGHDFRPEYTKLKFLKEQFAEVPLMALTATADPTTREDIQEQLGITNTRQFVASFDRPNLDLMVLPANRRIEIITRFIQDRPGQSGIIYCLARKTTEQIATKLRNAGFNAAHYHGQMTPEERNRVQEQFIRDQVPIICATVAFGMGIDKSNVRWVMHYNLPKNLEGYYQEIGRAGRDGQPSETILFYSYGDVQMLNRFIEEGGNQEVERAKLDSMNEYAQAKICRRKILLNYFGERLTEDCGHCDVCRNPPKYLDGTILAQKALSAVVRSQQKVGLQMLTDVLRGSRKKELLAAGHDKIKTFGAGADLSEFAWQQYLLQFIQLGLIRPNFKHNHVLELTPTGEAVLKGEQPVRVVSVDTLMQQRKQEAAEKAVRPKSKKELFYDGLADRLKSLRYLLAQEEGRAPYMVFSDATLEDMQSRLPVAEHTFKA
ncbi:MAG TPA: DNA helicase RecQ, partial [Cytophagales bacterium]|nr:DNA helicase RecQ [Cytophagales bacterium]